MSILNENIDILHLKQLTLDALDDCVIIANKAHELVYANHSAINFFRGAADEIRKDFPNFSVDNMLGKKIGDFHKDPSYQKKILDNLRGTVLNTIFAGDLVLSVRTTAILDHAQCCIGYIAEFENITEREKNKTDLLESIQKNLFLNSQMSQMQRVESISRLTAGISHDFNNILGVIVGYNQLSRYIVNEYHHAQLKEELLFNLDQVHIASERGMELIKKMMTYSRQNTADKAIEVNVTREVIEEVIGFMRPALTCAFTISATLDTSLNIQIDSTELHQILTNLIVNARDAMDTGGEITVMLKEIVIKEAVCRACVQTLKGKFVELTVLDNGIGIESDVVDHIFEPFFTTKEVGEGTGLGLSTVSGMVHGVDGHIIVESKTAAPTGTAFRLLFPIH